MNNNVWEDVSDARLPCSFIQNYTYFVMKKAQCDNLLVEFINDFAEGNLSRAELEAFSELQDRDVNIRITAQSGIRVRKYLKNTKKIKARPGFDQRMAARFAMELQRETQDLNKKQQSQPAVSS